MYGTVPFTCTLCDLTWAPDSQPEACNNQQLGSSSQPVSPEESVTMIQITCRWERNQYVRCSPEGGNEASTI